MSAPLPPQMTADAAAAAVQGVPQSGLLQAVLWDMDGTIVDTDPYWMRAERDLVHRFGGTFTAAQARALVGAALPTAAGILQDAGVQLTVREIIDELIRQVAAGARGHLTWRPGARELLAQLRGAGVPLALVTMSEPELADVVRGALPDGTFDVVVTGDVVEHGKPHPEPYRLAMDLLRRRHGDMDPHRVVAIEDSLPGVTSAEAAGTITVAVPHMAPLPPARSRTSWTTLEGRGVADLEDLVVARRDRTASGHGASEHHGPDHTA